MGVDHGGDDIGVSQQPLRRHLNKSAGRLTPSSGNRRRSAHLAVSRKKNEKRILNLIRNFTRMARIEIEDFSDKDISRIFIARNIHEAETAETLLNENDIAYAVQMEEFVGPGLFTMSAKKGVAFYVLSGQRDFCRDLFFRNDLKSGWIDDLD